MTFNCLSPACGRVYAHDEVAQLEMSAEGFLCGNCNTLVQQVGGCLAGPVRPPACSGALLHGSLPWGKEASQVWTDASLIACSAW